MAEFHLPVSSVKAALCAIKAEQVSPLTPFSAIAPSPLLVVSKFHVQISLQTIHEEEAPEDELFDAVSTFPTPATESVSHSLAPMCFLEVKEPFSTSSHAYKWRCA